MTSPAFAVPEFAVWRDELWDSILDLSALLDEGSWVLVGGQAVMAHALAHDGDEPSLPRDSDTTGHIVTTSSAVQTVHRSFQYLGFASTSAHIHPNSTLRFTREPEGTAPGQREQEWMIHVAGGYGMHWADQALARRSPYQATKGLRAPFVPVPDLLSTIIYEAAQFALDTVDPFVHARDAAFLLSLLDDPIRERTRLTPADRRALRVLDAAVGDRNHHVWTRLPFHRDTFTRWRLLLAV